MREYIDVFAWNYEDMLGLDPQVAMHRLNINPDAKPVKQQQRRFRLEIMEAIQSKVKKLIDFNFIREENTLIGKLILSPSPRRTGRSEFALIFVI